MQYRIIVTNSTTKIDSNPKGSILVAASHGGVYPAYLSASVGIRAAIFNDASVGKNDAGIAGLAYLQNIGIAAATVGYDTARIGDGKDMMDRGVISHANDQAQLLGCCPGMPCVKAALLFLDKASFHLRQPKPYTEGRKLIVEKSLKFYCLDSASLLSEEDYDKIVVTGSHGGLLGGDPATALKYEAVGAIFNDAGMGMDNVGISRLPALDKRHIAAATVSAKSACIGDGYSTYQDGIISAVNDTAAELGAVVGMSAKNFVKKIAIVKP